MQLVNNIDIIQINIKQGVKEYYFPKNVAWKNRVVDKIVLALAPAFSNEQIVVYSPIDGVTPLFSFESFTADCYFNLFNQDGEQILKNVDYTNLLYLQNYPIIIGQKLSLDLSRINFTQSPTKDGCILLYVFYGTRHAEDVMPPTKAITVNVPLKAAESISLKDIVDNYIYMQAENVKGIYIWKYLHDGHYPVVYLTLRDKDGKRSFNNVISEICQPPIFYNYFEHQCNTLWLDNINIDMLNSFVQNGTNTATEVKITFLY